MKFHYQTNDNQTLIRAEFEDLDSYVGKREEGAGTEITYSGDSLFYNYPVKQIHPDLLALICMVNYFPFIGKNVTFPMPVSDRLQKAFTRRPFLEKKEIIFNNIDPNLEPYSGNNFGIAFGGGVDSSAVHEMFPDAYVIHEGHIRNDELVYSPTHDITNSFDRKKTFLVNTNQRYVSNPGGWHSWPCSAACSLLLATDLDIGLIFTGTVLGSNWLWNGAKFHNRFNARAANGNSGNYWQSVFADIGIPMFSPIDGISEFGSMELSLSRLNDGAVNYCNAGIEGQHCQRCSKCLRKSIERLVLDSSYSIDWTNYDTDYIHSFLTKRPLYFGHIFKYADRKGVLPYWISELIKDVPEINSDWPIKYYPPALEFIPKGWEMRIKTRIMENFNMMSLSESNELENWMQ